MAAAERILTFVVRVVESSTGDLRAVIERVSTGRKQQVQTVEGIGLAIAAMALEEVPRDPERIDSSDTVE
ncbi:MAG TPA: hypothetical protein VIE36_24570 [Methylomirabilota bacterium]|jgi:hypothetical protein